MGKVVFEDPVHHISGKISKKYRTCYNHKRINGLNFTSVHGERSTPASVAELDQRAKFKTVRQAAIDAQGPLRRDKSLLFSKKSPSACIYAKFVVILYPQN